MSEESERNQEIIEHANTLARELEVGIEVKTMADVLTFMKKALGYES